MVLVSMCNIWPKGFGKPIVTFAQKENQNCGMGSFEKEFAFGKGEANGSGQNILV